MSVNIDLIIGGAGETDDDWSESLTKILALEPPPQHLSCYALTVEPGTPLASDPQRHPDEDAQAGRYEMAETDALGRRLPVVRDIQLGQARPRVPAQPPLLEEGEYRGIGCAAHSHRGGRRWWNVRTPERYYRRGRFRTVARGRIRGARRRIPESSNRSLSLASARQTVSLPSGAQTTPTLDGLDRDAEGPGCAHLQRSAARERGGHPASTGVGPRPVTFARD